MRQDANEGENMSHVDDGALHAYLDGELAPPERARLESHVAECAACRNRLDEERALIERASQLLGLAQPPGHAAPPPPLHQLRQPRLLWRLRLPLAWAATVLLALGVGYYARPGMPPQQGASVAPMPPETDAAPQIAASPAQAQADRGRRDAPAVAERKPAVPVERNMVAERRDTVAVAQGVVAMGREPTLRPVAPEPVPSAAVTTTANDRYREAARGRLVATEWPIIRRDPARQLLGADPVGVPGLAVREMRRSPAGDGVVLVEQLLDSTTVIQLFQQRADAMDVVRRGARQAAAPAAAPTAEMRGYVSTERLARFIGRLRVEIAGPLTPDSLNKLLEQVRPIP